MIQLSNISIRASGVRILNSVSLNLAERERVVLTGPSGCGKSSILKVLLAGLPWQQGRYWFDGESVTPVNITEIRQQAGYIGQESCASGELVRDVVLRPTSFSAYRDRQIGECQVLELFERLLLPAEILGQPFSALSGGQRQRVNIARVMVLQPRFIVADEPTSALDDRSAKAVIKELLGQESTVISSSHDPRWIGCCDRNLVMSQGCIVSEAQCE